MTFWRNSFSKLATWQNELYPLFETPTQRGNFSCRIRFWRKRFFEGKCEIYILSRTIYGDLSCSAFKLGTLVSSTCTPQPWSPCTHWVSFLWRRFSFPLRVPDTLTQITTCTISVQILSMLIKNKQTPTSIILDLARSKHKIRLFFDFFFISSGS